MKRKSMSIVLALITGMTVCAGFTGCATTSATESQNETTAAGSEAETTVEETTAEEVVIEDFADITATDLVSQIRTGWCLGNTLDSASDYGLLALTAEMHWGNPLTTEDMILKVKEAGFNAVRIPVTWMGFTAGAPEYKINPMWMKRVKEVVDYGIDNDMYVILNAHHETWYDLSREGMDENNAHLSAIWTQIADEFKGYDEHLIFEGMNEPRCIGTNIEWTGGDEESRECVNEMCQTFVDTVRATGGNNDKRLLMIPGYAASSAQVALAAIKVPDDDMIAVSVHAYTPYNFALANPGTASWSVDANTGDIDSLMNDLDTYFVSKGIPVILGEYGAMNKDNEEARCEWVTYYLSQAAEHNIPCFWWDNNAFKGSGENFGLLNRQSMEWVYPDLLDAMMKATESRVTAQQ